MVCNKAVVSKLDTFFSLNAVSNHNRVCNLEGIIMTISNYSYQLEYKPLTLFIHKRYNVMCSWVCNYNDIDSLVKSSFMTNSIGRNLYQGVVIWFCESDYKCKVYYRLFWSLRLYKARYKAWNWEAL